LQGENLEKSWATIVESTNGDPNVGLSSAGKIMARKRSAANVNPQEIFDLANGFYLSAQLISQHNIERQRGSATLLQISHNVVGPIETNMSLAVELYLKCLIALAKIQIPGEHNFARLFGALPSVVQASLNKRWNQWILEHSEGLKNADIPLKNDAPKLIDILMEGGGAFEFFRYIYERPAKPGQEYWTRPIAEIIRDEIQEQQPAWRTIIQSNMSETTNLQSSSKASMILMTRSDASTE
jgi:hypothetical protein